MKNIIQSFFSKENKKTTSKISVNNLDDFKYLNEAKNIFILFQKYDENCKIKLIGGCVRKLISGDKIDDIDIAVNLEPNKIKKILIEKNIKFIETGILHGTITIISNNYKFEITSLRKDIETDGRHAKVQFTNDWESDARRRDFTINAIYSDITGEIYDPLQGIEDLSQGKIKFIGDANKRIKEDYLRILRYVRFYTQYNKNHKHDEEIIKAIKINLDGLLKISKERLIDEFFKIIKLDNFNQLFEDEFCKFIILSIFPQLQNYKRVEILNKINNKNLQIDKILLLSVLLIDQSDNCDFFLFKYPISKENKKIIFFIKDCFQSHPNEYFYSKKNIIKLIYSNNKKIVSQLLTFLIFVNPKKINIIKNLIEFIKEADIPKFPINAEYLINEFKLVEGKELGKALKKIEKHWIENSFVIDEKEIKNIFKF